MKLTAIKACEMNGFYDAYYSRKAIFPADLIRTAKLSSGT